VGLAQGKESEKCLSYSSLLRNISEKKKNSHSVRYLLLVLTKKFTHRII